MQKLYLSVNVIEFMCGLLKNITLVMILLSLGGALLAAHKLSNIVNFKQSCHQKSFNAKAQEGRALYPVLLVEFEDVKFSVPNPKESFTALLNKEGYCVNGASGSAADYLKENFYNKVMFGFDVWGVVSLEGTMAQYGAHSVAFNDIDVPKLVEEACVKASAEGLDFSLYDNDSDGKIDNVAIIFAGYSESEGGSEDSIWPHQANMELYEITLNGVKLASYTCSGELKGCEGNVISTPGAFCHEFSHALGLPDLYDANGAEEGLASALYGSLSIMDKGNWLDGGNTPPYYSAPEREILGILEVEDLLPDKSYSLEPVHKGGKAYRIKTSNQGEYFLLECRSAIGWDTFIGGEGLVVYHIDRSNKVYGGIPSALRWEYNNLNCYAEHECVRVISAGGAGSSVKDLFFPGASGVKELLSDRGNVLLTDWGGHPVGIGIKDIRYEGGKVTFKTVEDYAFDPSLPPTMGCRAIPFQEQVRVEWLPLNQDFAGSEEYSWIIKWKLKGDETRWQSAVTDSLRYYVPNILPGNAYHIQVSALKGNLYGEAARLDVKSIPVTSLFPYIYVLEEGYSVGDVIDLRIHNLVEKHLGVEWYVNGNKVSGTSLLLNDEGEMQIVAIIRYPDGSDEKIYKNIKVSR